jgi:hypothetical protein
MGHPEARSCRNFHAKGLIGNEILIFAELRLQQAGAGCAVQRLTQPLRPGSSENELVLDPSETEASAVCVGADAQGIPRQFVDQMAQFLLVQRPKADAFGRCRPGAGGQNSYSARAVGTKCLQEPKTIPCA